MDAILGSPVKSSVIIYYLMKNVQPKALLFRYSAYACLYKNKFLTVNANHSNSNYRYLAALENMAQWPKNSQYAKKYNKTPSVSPVMGRATNILFLTVRPPIIKAILMAPSHYGEGWGGAHTIFRHWAIFRQCLFSNMASEEF